MFSNQLVAKSEEIMCLGGGCYEVGMVNGDVGCEK